MRRCSYDREEHKLRTDVDCEDGLEVFGMLDEGVMVRGMSKQTDGCRYKVQV